jgi:hypothetical protein
MAGVNDAHMKAVRRHRLEKPIIAFDMVVVRDVQ